LLAAASYGGRVQDSYNLERFVSAQNDGGLYVRALHELRRGQKTGHWMWFVFPQVAGLGMSELSQFYGIGSLAEARAFLNHPVLGARLVECATAVAGVADLTAEQILGEIDAMKLRSSMTLFHRAAPDEPLFPQVLDRFFAGIPDMQTDRILGK
jgi:uncharacterized protein (DUF1810 family)